MKKLEDLLDAMFWFLIIVTFVLVAVFAVFMESKCFPPLYTKIAMLGAITCGTISFLSWSASLFVGDYIANRRK